MVAFGDCRQAFDAEVAKNTLPLLFIAVATLSAAAWLFRKRMWSFWASIATSRLLGWRDGERYGLADFSRQSPTAAALR